MTVKPISHKWIHAQRPFSVLNALVHLPNYLWQKLAQQCWKTKELWFTLEDNCTKMRFNMVIWTHKSFFCHSHVKTSRVKGHRAYAHPQNREPATKAGNMQESHCMVHPRRLENELQTMETFFSLSRRYPKMHIAVDRHQKTHLFSFRWTCFWCK